jgi:hypothetical protein
MTSLTQELIEKLTEMDDDSGFTEMPAGEFRRLSDNAALFKVKSENSTHWFPLSQLRHLDGEIYVAEWILEKKGL